MTEEQQKRRVNWSWGIPASILLHAVFAFVLFFHIPFDFEEPQKEEAVNVEMVPPPEEKAEEQKKPEEQEKAKEEKPAEPPKQEEAKQEPPPSSAEEAEKASPIPTLRPVFEFGEQDQGPRKDETGNSSRETGVLPTEIQKPEILAAQTNSGGDASRPVEVIPTEKKLTEAKRLFSSQMTNDPVALTAMESMPREARAGQLCGTELAAQLHQASHSPELLPKLPSPVGNKIEERGAAFASKRQWYGVSFRCEVDADARKVVSFAFDIGSPIPKSEWRKRGFPEY